MILAAAAQALGRNKMRSALTMLGVFIGVAALIAMVAVGQGANEAVRKQIESLGTNLLVVLPGATTTGGVRAGSGSASTLTVTDAQAIRREDPAVGRSAISSGSRPDPIRQPELDDQHPGRQSPTIRRSPIGRSPPAAAISPDDESKAALVVVIGQTVYHQLFGADENPIGAMILVKGVPLRVIGMLGAKGQSTSARTRTIWS